MAVRMYKKQGVWVVSTGGRLTAAVVRATIEMVREERAQQVMGAKIPSTKRSRKALPGVS